MDVTEEVTATLRAEAHHPPVVLDEPAAAGFCTEHSAKAGSIGFEEETAPTLRAGVVPAAIALDNHPTDSRVKLAEDNVVQTLTSRMGTGGNNVPLVMDELMPQTLKIRSGCEGGGKGAQISGNAPSSLINITLPKAQFPNAESVCGWLREQYGKGTPVRAIYQLYTPVEEKLLYDDYLLRTYPRSTNIRFSNGNERIDPEMTVVVKTKAV